MSQGIRIFVPSNKLKPIPHSHVGLLNGGKAISAEYIVRFRLDSSKLVFLQHQPTNHISFDRCQTVHTANISVDWVLIQYSIIQIHDKSFVR